MKMPINGIAVVIDRTENCVRSFWLIEWIYQPHSRLLSDEAGTNNEPNIIINSVKSISKELEGLNTFIFCKTPPLV